ncbi:hypothetical protein SBRCBS47491_009614 [Sporothrix bragantina]|uniref:Protein kinase domain-containing protein n=1 Tax=Sporothrix bragantina TaxID=671064 RepID=A0ABP0CYV7_9PEZI
MRARWALEAVDRIAMLHAHEVIHANIQPDILEGSRYYMAQTPGNETKFRNTGAASQQTYAIRKCWHAQFASAPDLLEALKMEVLARFGYLETSSGIVLRCVKEEKPVTNHSS